jgi:uncharacterized protein DUF397
MAERETSPAWHKSSFSQNSDCAEWRFSGDLVLLRDSKDPSGPVIQFTHAEWRAFVNGVKSGQADLA